jgi:hypothetical protein
MEYRNPGLSRFEDEIDETIRYFGLDRKNLEIESYTPRTQLILIERVEKWRFRIHINIQENRIISVRQIETGAPAVQPETFSRYRAFMK